MGLFLKKLFRNFLGPSNSASGYLCKRNESTWPRKNLPLNVHSGISYEGPTVETNHKSVS
jgi:hypothetical protein